ncbi:receptor-type tyrosine-protein phosphatase H isoform X2 [Nothobranchius furzeri]|uniref:receptor-type tyrosine-protein phosphatase H isoform X2 n=1 Tax=Nothobranchius furzeri TaxID=105023 RepID=UPI0039048421
MVSWLSTRKFFSRKSHSWKKEAGVVTDGNISSVSNVSRVRIKRADSSSKTAATTTTTAATTTTTAAATTTTTAATTTTTAATTTTTTAATTTTTTAATTTTTAATTTKAPPTNPEDFRVDTQTENSINLKWQNVDDIDNYILNVSGSNINNSTTLLKNTTTHMVSNLICTSEYIFFLFTERDNVRSSGVNQTAVTAPCNPKKFKPTGQNESSITLKWEQIDGIDYYLLEKTTNLTKDYLQYTVSDLTSATSYNFSLVAVFRNVSSSGAFTPAVTAPRNPANFSLTGQTESSITLVWDKVDEVNNYTLVYKENETSISLTTELETYTVSDLQSASKYSFSLFAVFDYAKSSGTTITAVTAPENPADFSSVEQNETSITLQWTQVKDIQDYKIVFGQNTTNITLTTSKMQHTITNLEKGTTYNFSIFALFESINSSGADTTASTVPPQVSSVSVTERSLTTATLKWENPNKSWEYKVETNGTGVTIEPDISATGFFTISNLKPGTLYSYHVTTVFSGLNSKAYNDFLVTQIECDKIIWVVTSSSIQGTVEGVFTYATVSNSSNTSQHHSTPGSRNVSFTDLYPGATYEISLVYETSSTNFTQCESHPNVTTSPPSLRGRCENVASGYSALIVWDKAEGVLTKILVHMNGKNHTVDGKEDRFTIPGLQPAKTYPVALISMSGNRISGPFDFICATDNRGVIAGSVVGVLLFAVLVCVAAFILLKRSDVFRGKKSLIAGSKKTGPKKTTISVATFPEHFMLLSADENRGFSEEYENLEPVGKDQTHKAASLPENKSKNRFTNILPYDWSRVKLITPSPSDTLDYINANYMPGYNRNREYIASQGPLTATVPDFWRMVWEQRVKGIVMVTNCVESGRTKCDCYWPEDQKPCLYGDLLVTMSSEQKEPNWTLRNFRVKNRNNSEERTVKHFHFTAWPDHGVPQGTQVLIQFRGLIRQYIESEGITSPTVVHCSAGVGRTGTLIALDVLLQQLEKERAVGINDFVHRMRQHRSHMVQTESQYIFLHQCIMDCLKQKEKKEESDYENSDLIYANATALREFHNHNTGA